MIDDHYQHAVGLYCSFCQWYYQCNHKKQKL